MRTRILGAVVATGALVGASLVVLAGPAAATTISVANETEYRNALTTLSSDASGPHTINITADITLSNLGEPTYTGTQPLTLAGNGHTIDANGTITNERVLFEVSNPALNVEDLTMTDGNAVTGSGGAIGAAGSITLTNSTISSNTASGNGGGIAAPSVTLTNSTVSGNTAGGAGGGVAAAGAVTVTNSTISSNTASGNGGGVGANGAITVTNSTIGSNTASTGGGVAAGANAAVIVTNSTFSGNGASSGSGGGIAGTGSAVTVKNSTFSANTAVFGGAVSTGGPVTLVYATVAANTAPTGSNVRLFGTGAANLTSFGSVVALAQGGGANCALNSTSTTSNGSNYSDDASCGFTNTAQGDHENAGDPGLGALGDNGGSTQTRLPQSGSPLIDAIPTGSCQADGASGISTDQRGVNRPQGAGCDIGAVEVEVAAQPGPAAPVPATPVQAVVRFTG